MDQLDARRERFRFDGLPLLLFGELGVLVHGRYTLLELCMEFGVHASSSLVVGSWFLFFFFLFVI